MTVVLYHATTRDFELGQIVRANLPVQQYPNAVDALEAAKPPGAPSRATCVFATENAAFAVLYQLGQQIELEKIRLYRVELQQSVHAPFAAIHRIERLLSEGASAAALIAEYWNPTLAWKFFEYFGPSMVVMERVDLPIINEFVMRISYGRDFDLASTFS